MAHKFQGPQKRNLWALSRLSYPDNWMWSVTKIPCLQYCCWAFKGLYRRSRRFSRLWFQWIGRMPWGPKSSHQGLDCAKGSWMHRRGEVAPEFSRPWRWPYDCGSTEDNCWWVGYMLRGVCHRNARVRSQPARHSRTAPISKLWRKNDSGRRYPAGK